MVYSPAMTTDMTITNEQINSLPLLLGIIEQMGIRHVIDAHLTPHGAWQGLSVGTVVTLWLSAMLIEHDHRLVLLRDWVAERQHTIDGLLGVALRPTDCTDDRLANVLTMLGDPALQATLDRTLLQEWITLYRLPVETVRLDSTSVSVYHAAVEPDSLLQFGHSKDHRPDLRQFKAMVSALDPLGLPIAVQPVAGNRADDGLYIPAYDAATTVLGRSDVLVVGDSKMGALATRGHIVAGGSAYLCAYRPPSATAELAAWVEQALSRAEQWQTIDDLDETTGELTRVAVLDAWSRPQAWTNPSTGQIVTWEERVLVVRSQQQQDGLRARREATLQQLTSALEALRQPPRQGRKSYRTQAELQAVVAQRLAAADLAGMVDVAVVEETLANGRTRWTVGQVTVDATAWEAMVARLGWHVYVSNTTPAQYAATTLVRSYRQQPVQERGFSRLKTRNLQIRPVYLRDEQRIAGLLWLLTLALRVLVVTEQRVRAALVERDETLAGLNPGSRSQTTSRPTTERMIAVFSNITLTLIEGPGLSHRHVTALSPPQAHIVRLLALPSDLYERVAGSAPKLVTNLRE